MEINSSETLVGTKVNSLRAPRGAIDRARLDVVRAAASFARLVTLTAPGGFGKTTLAAAWTTHWLASGHHCAWLSLEQDDDEPVRFMHGLAHAVDRLGPGVGQSALALLQGSVLAAPRAVVSLLVNDLEKVQGEVFVVLDDFQWIHDSAVHDAMAFLVSHAPPTVHLVITSREAPPLMLSRLRAHGEWLNVDANALRFDPNETDHFLRTACAQPPTAAQIVQLHASTGGWAAALRIAALGPGGAGVLETSASGASRVFTHLIEDLLASIPADTVRFMAQTAVLEHLTVDLCNAVTAQENSAELLDQLEQVNQLVEPLDSEGRWLRYPQLLRDYLRGPLTQRLKIDQVQLHRRAAQWCACQSAWTDAVRHALAAGDSTQAIEWMVHCCMALVKTGDLMTLVGWRRQFPAELLRSQPSVQLAVAWGLTLAMRYEDAVPLLAEIERANPLVTGHADAQAQCLAVHAVAAGLQDDSARAGELARAWRELGVQGDAWTFNVVSNVMRYVHWVSRDWAGAYEQPWEPYSFEEDRRNVFSTVYREVILGYVEMEQGRLGLAERHAREALRQAEMHAGTQSVSAALAAPLLAMLHYEQGRLEEAGALLHPLVSLTDNIAILESVMQTYLVLSRIAWCQGQCERAFELIGHAEAIGYNRGWDRLVGAMLLERLKRLIGENRLDEANATGVRLARLAALKATLPSGAHTDLLVFRDWGQALVALADRRASEARIALTRLFELARSERNDLRAIQTGTSLVLAHMADDERDAGFETLREVLLAAQRIGANRSILDAGGDLQAILPRFLVSSHCNAELATSVRRLLAVDANEADKANKTGVAGTLTERERDVLMLVASGQSNKEVARAMNISAETVKTHLKSIFGKIGVQQREQAVVLARAVGLIAE